MSAVYRNGVAVVIVCRQSLPIGHPLGDACSAEESCEAGGSGRLVPGRLRFLCGQRTDGGGPWHFVQGGIEAEDAGLTVADITEQDALVALSGCVGDDISIAAAYREAREEIGFRPEHLKLVGPIHGPPAPTAEAVARGEAVVIGANVPAGDTTTPVAAALSCLLPVPNFAFRFDWFYEKHGRRGQQHYPVLFLVDESAITHCSLRGEAGDRQEFRQVAWLTADELLAVAEADKIPMLSAMTAASAAQLLDDVAGPEGDAQRGMKRVTLLGELIKCLG